MRKYRHFSERDFEKAFPQCSIDDMNTRLMLKLDTAREIAECPFIINSAYRSVNWEIMKGRSGRSSHTKGLAVDIKCLNNQDRFKMIDALIAVGFRRIGIYRSFIHVDLDDSKDDCIFLG